MVIPGKHSVWSVVNALQTVAIRYGGRQRVYTGVFLPKKGGMGASPMTAACIFSSDAFRVEEL